jgi:hypothetical protein
MAFVKTAAKAATADPRHFTIMDGIKASITISFDDQGGCKGFQVGYGRFCQLKVPASMFGILKPEVVKAATLASEAVDAAMKAGKYVADNSKGFSSWKYQG